VNLSDTLAEAREYLAECEGLYDSRDLTEAVINDGTITLGALRVLTEAAALGEANWNLVAAIKARDRIDREFEVTGQDTVMYCLAHRRKLAWLPLPGWWIHDNGHRPLDFLDGSPTDPRGCRALWNAPAPITVTRRTA
jgi:hypothetical protein